MDSSGLMGRKSVEDIVESVVGARGVRAGDVVRKEDLLGRSGRSGRLRIRALNGRIDRS